MRRFELGAGLAEELREGLPLFRNETDVGGFRIGFEYNVARVIQEAGTQPLGQDRWICLIYERDQRLAPTGATSRARELVVESDHLQRPACAGDRSRVLKHRSHLRA